MGKVPSIKELRQYCKTGRDELINMRIVRWISVYPLRLLLYTNISANHLSLAWMIGGLIAGAYTRFQDLIYIYAGFISVLFVLMDPIMRLKRFHIYSLNNKTEMLKKISNETVLRHKNRFLEYIIEFFRPQAFNAMLFAAIFDVLNWLLLFYAIVLPIDYLKTTISGYKETAGGEIKW